MYKNIPYVTKIKLSNLSRKPPWPGMSLLEFFILDNLLKYDSIISPKKDRKIIDKIIRKKSKT